MQMKGGLEKERGMRPKKKDKARGNVNEQGDEERRREWKTD